ncbi:MULTISPECIES: TFIIB-type zinc ribbon-containing protein [unclassified Sulfitobacter]|uniref:TFIIB-type zinc ribbon-containing protein n=1 Tax=unclassified Sulfitobacter TaxID=196795 RepID=UPI0007C2679E|nr:MULTISPECIES: zf-TFIIB domain-containing protein [unclassified Sulfitobacter]KZX92233.1 hypothetical protein A3720_07475 [Sulfitobacter sp. HI0021]KZY02021.1 hypothetical protein A3722_06490 [Sulfitobacter sp. HI0027]KZY98502.1 hypothetical protein A3747_07990 [Sulfitobacter sp. HI0076]
MKCPLDGTELVMTDRSGVEIDYCPQCRGVWLDRGELDKIIERSAVRSQPSDGPQQATRRTETRYDHDRQSDDDKRRYQGAHGNEKKRKSFLGELFDF